MAKYGGAGPQSPGPGSNETSPISPRKMSSSSTCGQEHKNSPPVFRKPSHPAPQRPSKLPVMPMYNNNQVSKQSSMEQTMSRPLRPSHYQGRKLTPPCSSDQESVSMSPVSSMTKHNRIMYPMSAKRAASPSRTTSKRQGQMSPKRNDISRRVSSPVYTSVARRRSPSLTRSVSFYFPLKIYSQRHNFEVLGSPRIQIKICIDNVSKSLECRDSN